MARELAEEGIDIRTVHAKTGVSLGRRLKDVLLCEVKTQARVVHACTLQPFSKIQ
jgi:hypothetical protein